MKKILALVLAAALAAGAVNVYAQMPSEDTYAASVYTQAQTVEAQCGSYHESIYITWSGDPAAKVYYKESGTADYTQLDSELVRKTANGGRADIVGIKAGYYDVKLVTSTDAEFVKENIPVDNYDRSGYAHFKRSAGVGGYNNDGTPKDGAVILYVDNSNKNTITYGGKTGIGNILANASKYSNPLIVRFIGTVDTQTRDEDGTKTTDQKNGVVALNGLTDQVQTKDSYFNMMDIKNAENITIEGIGTDAVIDKWGFTFSDCQSVEARNLTFRRYPEDACSFLGSNGRNFWLHNCTFETGENKYDLTEEQDKHEGDGSSDIAKSQYITFSYNRFIKCHKTSLNGNGDSVKQYHITWHHNFFDRSSSRMPLARQANIHSYNNYFYNCGTCIDARASAWILSEANYFHYDKESDVMNAIVTRAGSYGKPIVKSYNDVFDGNARKLEYYNNSIFTAASRDEKYDADTNVNPYPNFDTNPSVFYYANGKTNVLLLETAEQAKENCIKNSGVMTGGGDVPVVPEPTTVETTTETTTLVTEVAVHTPEAGKTPSSDTGSADLNTVTYRAETDDYYILDRSSSATTIWRVPFDTQTDGATVVRGKVTPQVTANKWTLVQVRGLNSDGVEDCIASLATNTEGTLCLRTGADSYMPTAKGITKQRTYTYELVVDLDAQTAYLSLDGEEHIGIPIKARDVSSVYFMTASKAADRDITVTMPAVFKVLECAYILGDADADGSLTAGDAAELLQKTLTESYTMPIESKTADWLEYTDVDGDKKITANDAANTLQKVLNEDFAFPAAR